MGSYKVRKKISPIFQYSHKIYSYTFQYVIYCTYTRMEVHYERKS